MVCSVLKVATSWATTDASTRKYRHTTNTEIHHFCGWFMGLVHEVEISSILLK